MLPTDTFSRNWEVFYLILELCIISVRHKSTKLWNHLFNTLCLSEIKQNSGVSSTKLLNWVYYAKCHWKIWFSASCATADNNKLPYWLLKNVQTTTMTSLICLKLRIQAPYATKKVFETIIFINLNAVLLSGFDVLSIWLYASTTPYSCFLRINTLYGRYLDWLYSSKQLASGWVRRQVAELFQLNLGTLSCLTWVTNPEPGA